MKIENIHNPLISVVMPVFNAEAYLEEAILSILAQTYSRFELIIIDDCSTDDSAEIIRKYARKDGRIRPLYIEHRGAGGAANVGIAAASGEIVARMDADDIALPERFAKQLAWMQQTSIDICGTCIKSFGAESRIMWFPETHEAITFEMLFRCALMQPTVMMHAEIAKAHPYNENLLFEDYELWTRLAPKYRMGNVPQVLQKYRMHHQQRHVQNAVAVRNELQNYSRNYFCSVFPDASVNDQTLIARIVCSEPMQSLNELERTGELLVRCASIDDNYLLVRTAHRWLAVCIRSAHLGFGCYKIFLKKTLEYGVTPESRLTLWIACALRLRSGSWFEKGLRHIKRLWGKCR